MEARVVAEAVGAAGADDVGARFGQARACKKLAKHSEAAQASSVAEQTLTRVYGEGVRAARAGTHSRS